MSISFIVLNTLNIRKVKNYDNFTGSNVIFVRYDFVSTTSNYNHTLMKMYAKGKYHTLVSMM